MFDTVTAWVTNLTLATLLPVVVLLVVGVVVIKAILKLIDKTLEKSRLEKAAATLLKSLAKAVLYLLLAMMVADRLGIDVTGVVALASVASLALSLSLQDMLGNLIGGFVLLSKKPFKSGDYVDVAGQSGVIQSIDMSYTTLTTPDNKVISIPNSAVVASQIVNYSTADTRRVDIAVSASYDAPIETVKAALLKAAQVEGVLADPAPFVGLTKYGDSAIEYVLRVWCPNAKYWDVTFAINENVKAQFDAAGVEMTFPHLNVHLDK